MLGGILSVIPTSQTQAQSISVRAVKDGCHHSMYPDRWNCGKCFSQTSCSSLSSTPCGTCYVVEDNLQDPGYYRISMYDNGNIAHLIYCDSYTETEGTDFVEITWHEVPDRNW